MEREVPKPPNREGEAPELTRANDSAGGAGKVSGLPLFHAFVVWD